MTKGGWIPARVALAFMCAAGTMELYMSRINLSIAIVAMVQTVTSDTPDDAPPRQPYCVRSNHSSVTFGNESLANLTRQLEYSIINGSLDNDEVKPERTPPIKLTSVQKGNVLAAFFYAYGFAAIPGGRLAEIYGAKKVFGMGVLMDCIANFLIPIAAKTRIELLIFIRFVMGVFQAGCYPSIASLTARWIPPDETSRFVSFTFLSNSFGTIFSLTISGLIIDAYGWEWSFYVCGCFSFAWLIMWTLLMYDTPDEHPRISEEEKRYIMESKAAVNHKMKLKSQKMPWMKMVTSVPIWAICIAGVGNMFGLNVFVTQLPSYMSSILGIKIRNNGILSALPFLARFLGGNFFSWCSSFLKRKIDIPLKTWKIILTIIGFGGPATAVVIVGYVGCSVSGALSLFIIGLFLNGAIIPGFAINGIEIVPNYAGTVTGFSAVIAVLFGMLAPLIIGALTPEETLDEWIHVYWTCFTIYIVTGTIYCVFCSTDVLPWNDPVEEEKEETLEHGNHTKLQAITQVDDVNTSKNEIDEIDHKNE